jgi:predicted enzyme related to lactoylglutathione lyase
MQIQGVSWVGIRTEQFEEVVGFFRRLGLAPCIEARDFVMFKLPDGDQIEVFGPSMTSHAHFVTGPVVGFRVPDVVTTRAELEAAGAELIGRVHREGGSAWQHFRGPDGNIYEINSSLP